MFPRTKLRYYIASMFLLMMVGFAAVNIVVNYWQTREMLLSDANVLFKHIGGEVHLSIDARYEVASLAAEMLAASPVTRAETQEERLASLPMLAQILDSATGASAPYVGYANGDFVLIRPFDRRLVHAADAPPGTAYMVQTIKTGGSTGPVGSYFFYDAKLRQLGMVVDPAYRYDPRGRPWYGQAVEEPGTTIAVDPYVFYTTREAGTTLARSFRGGVAGIDITLGSLSAALASLRPTPSADLLVFDGRQRVVIDSHDMALAISGDEVALPGVSGELRIAMPTLVGTEAQEVPVPIEIGDRTWIMMVRSLGSREHPLYAGLAAPRDELLVESEQMRDESLMIALAVLAFAVPVTLALSSLASRPVEALTRMANEARALRFDTPPAISTPLVEIDELAKSMSGMTATIRQLLAINAGLAGEGDLDTLMVRVIDETCRITSARGGIIYLDEADGTLVPAHARWAGHDHKASIPELRPEEDAGHPVILALDGKRKIRRLNGADVRRLYPSLGYGAPLEVFAVPLRNREGETVGVLLLLIEIQGRDQAISREVIAFVEAVSGTAAVSIETRRRIREQRQLFKGVITLLAGAIDTKSPYTGGHCQRVPALMEMLAGAAVKSNWGPFRSFDLTEAQWEELRVASWLHDCGKITSPEYVIDKATKLETIYDRLHEVRMRFEVVKREAEVAAWQAIAAGSDAIQTLARLKEQWAAIDSDFAFVASCNEGSEFMAPDRIDRLHRIAMAYEWTRTLDDRIGLAWEERDRKNRTMAPELPVKEPVLSDRPEHVIERPPAERLSSDNPWGFKVEVPANLYNRGELYNLSIARGTLTTEERYKINEHMIATIRMLSDLPLPTHLRNVPEIAGGHHEKMDGTGYPRRLKRDEMSLPARMMAVADIFEALTAGDRPYKKAKTLAQAIAIMAQMRDTNHIDPDVFELFLTSGIYRDYADRFLASSQIDEVDIEPYLRIRRSA